MVQKKKAQLILFCIPRLNIKCWKLNLQKILPTSSIFKQLVILVDYRRKVAKCIADIESVWERDAGKDRDFSIKTDIRGVFVLKNPLTFW